MATEVAISPLTKIPAELRILIYRYLIPDVEIPTWPAGRSRPPLRHDGHACCPALLRTNRMIYNELLVEWYGSQVYHVRLKHDEISFLNHQVPHRISLPLTLRALQHLHLWFQLEVHPDCRRRTAEAQNDSGSQYRWRDRVESFEDRVRELVQCFPAGQSSLRRLSLRLWAPTPFVLRAKGKPEVLRKALQWNLRPLQAIRVPHKVSIEIEVAPHLFIWMDNHAAKAAFLAVARDYLDAVEKEMSKLCKAA